MALRVPVYATRITSLSDARYFAGMGVRFLGICADPQSPDFFPAGRFREISGWVTGPEFVLEVDSMDGDPDLSRLAAEYGVSVFRINVGQQQFAIDSGVRFGIAGDVQAADAEFTVGPVDRMEPANDRIHFASEIRSINDASELLNNYPGAGLMVQGSPEQQPGVKEYDAQDLLEFLDADQD
ncbi:MAG: hypothetical protein ACKORJ_07875 [Bacteroidota bacterium]